VPKIERRLRQSIRRSNWPTLDQPLVGMRSPTGFSTQITVIRRVLVHIVPGWIAASPSRASRSSNAFVKPWANMSATGRPCGASASSLSARCCWTLVVKRAPIELGTVPGTPELMLIGSREPSVVPPRCGGPWRDHRARPVNERGREKASQALAGELGGLVVGPDVPESPRPRCGVSPRALLSGDRTAFV
jgi:hypothetical protein